jgi:hypothetical protein
MNPLKIAAIVEGDGETLAVPALVRRFGELAGWSGRVQVDPVLRQPASKLLKPEQLERLVELAARKLGCPGGILVILDCEDDCPATLGPQLLARIRAARHDFPSALVLAHREYEAWFMAAAESIAGRRGLPTDLRPPPHPETIRGCKEWLSRHLPRGVSYRECDDQTALSTLFDMEAARRNSRSFDKCYREITRLLLEVASITPGFTP